ncbi:MAG: hypothetical protein P8Y91_07275 [Desulfuromonadales bacterium]
MRIALGIEYDGTDFHGWQRQRVGHGVQEVVERKSDYESNSCS